MFEIQWTWIRFKIVERGFEGDDCDCGIDLKWKMMNDIGIGLIKCYVLRGEWTGPRKKKRRNNNSSRHTAQESSARQEEEPQRLAV